ncbi:zinc finger CCHC domain-containing protein 13 [Trichonephila inaurata madagascariensis]|uniref:Zinc finger CCHC domain-containing protein 13 n=1 Tax=Trichonephila inaurata madagascariensis TaxID=2747483 RepID=A0A8X6ISR8_9ARAC|nr:zinc finger CCHC domain-containing protein 13 [Trichonephila inaurata madagascariensis]
MEKLNADDPIEREIKSNFANLERIYSDLTELDNQICGFLLENSNDDKYEAEYLAVEEYSAKMTHTKIKIGEERIRLAKTDFAPKVRYNERKEKISRSSYATTTNLFSGLEKMKKLDNCIFCEKRHESKECYHTKKLDFEQKQEILKNKRCCFTCLKFGYQSKVFKSNVQCLLCNKRHWALMCPEFPSNKMRVKTPDLEEKRDVTLSNHCAAEKVLLQTLQVNIKAGGKTRRVRALIDSGSQRSYLLKNTAHEMNLKPIEMKNIIHSVFGGSTFTKTRP